VSALQLPNELELNDTTLLFLPTHLDRTNDVNIRNQKHADLLFTIRIPLNCHSRSSQAKNAKRDQEFIAHASAVLNPNRLPQPALLKGLDYQMAR
jgi:hypothetical protein